MKNFNFTTKQAGYGRQHLYANGIYIMDIFPNIQEHFNIKSEENAFSEDGITHTDCNGNKLDGVYSNLNDRLSEHLQEEVLKAFEDRGLDEDGEEIE
jgi:hypothetical protein